MHTDPPDPVNAVKIFNDKEVDELIFLDITATAQGRKPNIRYIQEIATEAFMPLCYGGGLTNMEDIRAVIKAGIEKVEKKIEEAEPGCKDLLYGWQSV